MYTIRQLSNDRVVIAANNVDCSFLIPRGIGLTMRGDSLRLMYGTKEFMHFKFDDVASVTDKTGQPVPMQDAGSLFEFLSGNLPWSNKKGHLKGDPMPVVAGNTKDDGICKQAAQQTTVSASL